MLKAIGCSVFGGLNDQILLDLAGCSKPDLARGYVDAYGARRRSAYFLFVDDDACLPEDLAHRLMIPLTDVEGVIDGQHLSSADCHDLEAGLDGSELVSALEEQRDAGVGEDEGPLTCFSRIKTGLGQHVMQKTGDKGDRIVDQNGDAGAESVRNKHVVRVFAELALTDANDD
jgi:hypothetical protein